MSERAGSEGAQGSDARLRPGMVLLMAVATGAAVANIYYAQPLLATLADAFGVATHSAGFLVTVTQTGYLLGLLFLVPLGDLLERRNLVVTVSLSTALCLAGAAFAPTLGVFAAASLGIGVTAVVAQILVPYAAHLAPETSRGRVVGRVMSGLLLGILLARTVAGVLSELWGWRSVFAFGAVLMTVQALALYLALPRDRSTLRMSYFELLVSVLALIGREPVLRRRMVYGALSFATFSVLWTALPFLLSRPPYEFGDAAIGSFGLAGAAGALSASFAGHLHDRGRGRVATGAFIALVAVAFTLMGLWPLSLAAIMVGVVLLDTGVQGTQILNQSRIYQLDGEARSRITTAYMGGYFFGGAAGSAAAAYAFSVGGWAAVAGLGVALPVLALAYWTTELRH